MSQNTRVSIHQTGRGEYPSDGPFHPTASFPEYPHAPRYTGSNWVYESVRQILLDLQLDATRFGTPDWNPLGDLLKPGQSVVIKPNMVISEHELGVPGLLASVANGSIIRPLVDYAFKAIGPEGRLTIADSPIKEVDFTKIAKIVGIDDIVNFYADQGFKIEVLDIRDLQAYRDKHGVIIGSRPLAGDPRGYTVVDLGRASMLARVPPEHHHRFRSTAAIYESEAMRHHTATVNEYSMPRSILEADALISVAKLKVHRKSGITAALKNAIGTTNEKRWLPHHRAGSPSQGGDMVPDQASVHRKTQEALADLASRSRYGKVLRRDVYPLLKWLYQHVGRRVVDLKKIGDPTQDFNEGDWYGNDTIWRTTLDINMVLRFADRNGALHDEPVRRYLAIIDGIVGGEREGPLHPSPKESGVVIGGLDPVAVDLACTTLMGFDYTRVATVASANEVPRYLGTNRMDEVELCSNVPDFRTWDGLRTHHAGYIAPRGWGNAYELPPSLGFPDLPVARASSVPAGRA